MAETGTVAVTYDADPGITVQAGEALRTTTGRTYLVVNARRVRSRVAPNRFALRCVIVEGAPEDAKVHELRWYRRGS